MPVPVVGAAIAALAARLAAKKAAEEVAKKALAAATVKKVLDAKKAIDAEKAAETASAAKAAEAAKKAEDAAKAADAARKAEAAKKADAAKKAADTKKAEDAAKAAEAKKIADAKKAADARKALEDKAAEAKRLADAKKIDDARKAADAKKAEEAAKKAEEARKLAAAEKAAKLKKAEDAKKAREDAAAAARKVIADRNAARLAAAGAAGGAAVVGAEVIDGDATDGGDSGDGGDGTGVGDGTTGNPNQNPDRNYDEKYGAFSNDGAGGDGDTGGGGGGDTGGGDGNDGTDGADTGAGGGGATDSQNWARITAEDAAEDTPDPVPVEDAASKFEKTWLILRAKLLAAGLPVATVDKSVDFFRTIITDGKFSGSNEISDVVDQYLYSKSYKSKSGTEIASPFYEKFGKFNDQLKIQKKPDELVKLVLGYERLVDKYKVSDKFKTDESMAKYMKNDTSVAELDERMNSARLRALEADKAYTQTLRALNYITEDSQLTDFFLDPEIGTIELESRRKTVAFATEAVRRASSGITLDTASAQQLSARFTALGYSEAQQANLAGEKYSNIAGQLQETTALSGIYEKAGAADAPTIQKELESEQFLGMASARRKKLAEQNIKAFSGASGLSRYGLSTGAVGSII